MKNSSADLDRFYELLGGLSASTEQGNPLATYTGKSELPAKGVYFFQEPNEYRADGATPRIVRVGTHAVSADSKATLWHRLRAHLGSRSGSGHHRGSVFRRHVGKAILLRDEIYLPSWGQGSVVPANVRADTVAMTAEAAHELKVSEYIGKMRMMWIEVSDHASTDSMRAFIEKNAIALLSNMLNPIEEAGGKWLGRHSPVEEITRSYLWNVNHVRDAYDETFLDRLEFAVERTLGRSG